MEPHRVQPIHLTCHPDTPSSAVHHIVASLCREPDGLMQITYALHADLARVRIPPPGTAARTDRLWQHTCFELFVRREGGPAYHELNFSPSGAWAAYAFSGYREGAAPAEQAANPRVETSVRNAHKLTLDASLRLDTLSPLHACAKLAVAISAVIEESDGALSYWALRHPAGGPDFHHAHGYALELAV
jgi:hypothetical protein